MDTTHSRRHFLAGILWALLVALRSNHAWAALTEQRGRMPFNSRLVTLLKHEESARIIGHEYLRMAPHEANVHVLLGLISLGHTDSSIGTSDQNPESLREQLQLRTCRDFEEGQIVKIRGWMLSLTETRLCALVALVSRSGRWLGL
jgi:hypothetical protein